MCEYLLRLVRAEVSLSIYQTTMTTKNPESLKIIFSLPSTQVEKKKELSMLSVVLVIVLKNKYF